ncbi:MAG: NAD(P)/FAD-dependent oxidoreductase [Bradyrhizobiaceae bacterium]|nr:NAD(P)/FAD-dependent oxidoreductase [Bradyrhizobiaceae bacterium]
MTDVIVLGGGAAGLMCAATAGKHGLRTILLEHNATPGRKIRISGGGRCNFTNRVVGARNFISSNQHFVQSALARYTPDDFIALVNRYGIAWHEKTLGQLFCDGSAQQIIDMLVDECVSAGVELRCGVTVNDVDKSDVFTVRTSDGYFESRTVVLATGGLSIPKLGASGIAYRIARKFGLAVVPTKPALVPLICDDDFAQSYGQLAGVSTPCVATASGVSFAENMLFTHRGLSGPAILQASSYLNIPDSVELDLLPAGSAAFDDVPQSDKRLVRNIASEHIPSRLASAWTDPRFSMPRNSISAKTFSEAISTLRSWKIPVVGTEGYAKAEVTGGGIDTHGLSSKTMEARSVPGLYVIGECADVTGWLGGYNFQWAWSSGYAAGIALRDRISASSSVRSDL